MLFSFQMHMPASMWDSVIPFGLEEIHLMTYGHPTWPTKVKINICIHAVWLSLLVSEMLSIKDEHSKVYR
jgi:hypothetical protein